MSSGSVLKTSGFTTLPSASAPWQSHGRTQNGDVLCLRLAVQGLISLLLTGAELLLKGPTRGLIVLAFEHRRQC